MHLDLASTFSEALAPVNEGILFRAEAVLAPLAALALIAAPRRLTFLPFHDLYGPVWFPEKLRAAFGEAGPVLRHGPGSCSC